MTIEAFTASPLYVELTRPCGERVIMRAETYAALPAQAVAWTLVRIVGRGELIRQRVAARSAR